jgi:hypothetical protein
VCRGEGFRRELWRADRRTEGTRGVEGGGRQHLEARAAAGLAPFRGRTGREEKDGWGAVNEKEWKR